MTTWRSEPTEHSSSPGQQEQDDAHEDSLRLAELLERMEVYQQTDFMPDTVVIRGVMLRPLYIPDHLITTFISLAHSNTQVNRETIGYLLGMDLGEKLVVAELLVPTQTGSADTCESVDHAAVTEYVLRKDMLMLGWIHTHPQYAAFMSRTDVGTQHQLQSLQPEMVAVVCGSQDSRNVVFQLTEEGLNIIQNFRTTNSQLHFNPRTLYQEAKHVFFRELPLKVVDQRSSPDERVFNR